MTLHKIEVFATTTLRHHGTVDVDIPDDVDEIAANDLVDEALADADLNAWENVGGGVDFEFTVPGEGRPLPPWLTEEITSPEDVDTLIAESEAADEPKTERP